MNNNILARLEMKLEASGLTYHKASDFQGVLFNKIDENYADFLHQQQLHPYSQSIIFKDNQPYWRVNTTNKEAYDHIIKPLLNDDFNSFFIKNGQINVKIKEKTLSAQTYENLLSAFYEEKAEKMIKLDIETFTAFKQRGKYVVLPDLRLIYQSLMKKYSVLSDNFNMIDEDTLEQLVSNSLITAYRLKTGLFPLEGQTVPGFMGNISIRFFGTETMARYARMLFEFGQYSGIGIKNGMGMGAIRIIQKESKNKDA